MNRIKCPRCEEQGLKSRVHLLNSQWMPGEVEVYYDQEGREHRHDKGVTVMRYSCDLQHEGTLKRNPSCWCGWPYDETTDEAVLEQRFCAAQDVPHQIGAKPGG